MANAGRDAKAHRAARQAGCGPGRSAGADRQAPRGRARSETGPHRPADSDQEQPHGRTAGEARAGAGGGGGRGAAPQFTLSTASMKLSVLVSTHSAFTASTPIVPIRSVLLLTTPPLFGADFMSPAPATPRRLRARDVRTSVTP